MGIQALMGGLNIGDEYRGKNTRFEAWRDTHLKIKGTNVKVLTKNISPRLVLGYPKNSSSVLDDRQKR